jgi:hypothetical protein
MIFSSIDVRTIVMSPFGLTYGMKPRLPSFPIPELTRISNGKGFVAERMQLLKKARQITMEQSMQASDCYKNNHDTNANLHEPNRFRLKSVCKSTRINSSKYLAARHSRKGFHPIFCKDQP